MNTYKMIESQNFQSERAGVLFKARNLSLAKRHVTVNQAFHGTVLILENEQGHIVARKERDGSWMPQSYLA